MRSKVYQTTHFESMEFMSPKTFLKWFFSWVAALRIDFRAHVDPYCMYDPPMLVSIIFEPSLFHLHLRLSISLGASLIFWFSGLWWNPHRSEQQTLPPHPWNFSWICRFRWSREQSPPKESIGVFPRKSKTNCNREPKANWKLLFFNFPGLIEFCLPIHLVPRWRSKQTVERPVFFSHIGAKSYWASWKRMKKPWKPNWKGKKISWKWLELCIRRKWDSLWNKLSTWIHNISFQNKQPWWSEYFFHKFRFNEGFSGINLVSMKIFLDITLHCRPFWGFQIHFADLRRHCLDCVHTTSVSSRVPGCLERHPVWGWFESAFGQTLLRRSAFHAQGRATSPRTSDNYLWISKWLGGPHADHPCS